MGKCEVCILFLRTILGSPQNTQIAKFAINHSNRHSSKVKHVANLLWIPPIPELYDSRASRKFHNTSTTPICQSISIPSMLSKYFKIPFPYLNARIIRTPDASNESYSCQILPPNWPVAIVSVVVVASSQVLSPKVQYSKLETIFDIFPTANITNCAKLCSHPPFANFLIFLCYSRAGIYAN